MEQVYHEHGGSKFLKSIATLYLEVGIVFDFFLNGAHLYVSFLVADNGCLQYYTGVSGTITSFNYDNINGRQLSNQDYSICIRTESNFCGIAYSVCNNGVFSITGPSGGSATTPGTPVGALVRN